MLNLFFMSPPSRKASKTLPPTSPDHSLTLETVLYLLEDSELPSSGGRRHTSRELSGTRLADTWSHHDQTFHK